MDFVTETVTVLCF